MTVEDIPSEGASTDIMVVLNKCLVNCLSSCLRQKGHTLLAGNILPIQGLAADTALLVKSFLLSFVY